MKAVVLASEIAKNVVMSSSTATRLRSRWRGGRTTGRLDVGASVDRIDAALRFYRESIELVGLEGLRWSQNGVVLEVGPGSNAGVVLHLLGSGARRAYLVDRFHDLQARPHEREIYEAVLDGYQLDPSQRAELLTEAMSPLDPENGRVRFVHQPLEDLMLSEPVDLIVSHYVLQHLVDLSVAFSSMAQALAPGGIMVHLVDVATLGPLNPQGRRPLALLEHSPTFWRWLSRNRALTSQARLSDYRRAAEASGLELLDVRVLKRASNEAQAAARPRLHPAFQNRSDEDLAPLHFGLVARKTAMSPLPEASATRVLDR